MSKTSRNIKQNYEQLYYSLKDEYSQMQKDNNEIFKEYESTIQMLTDSIKELQSQRSAMTKKLSEIEKEKEKLKNKNLDKIIDIQDLNKQNEKLNQEIKNIKEEKKIKDTKIIILENDTEHFQKLIRQNEAIIDELNYKLEEALEENITIQTEFEIYKQIMGEQLMRKEEEIKEIKNDMFSKNLMIEKLNKREYINNSEKLFQLNYKAAKSTNKKNKSNRKINHSYSYNRDIKHLNPLRKDNNLLNNFFLNSNRKNNVINQINTNNSFIPLISLLTSIKISPKKYKLNFSHSKSIKNNSNKSNLLKTPSKNKIKNVKFNSTNYNHNCTNKKNNDNDSNKFKKINKFVIDSTDDINDDFKNDETTVDLSVFSVENDFPSIMNYNEKVCTDRLIIYDTNKNKKSIGIEPFKGVFLKKLLYSKKLSNNFGQLFGLNLYKKRKIIMENKKCNKETVKIGYKIK